MSKTQTKISTNFTTTHWCGVVWCRHGVSHVLDNSSLQAKAVRSNAVRQVKKDGAFLGLFRAFQLLERDRHEEC